MTKQYLTTHNSWDPHSVVSLPVDTADFDEIFVDPIWGIRIEKVTADERTIAAGDYNIVLDDMNLNKMKVNRIAFIYTVRFGSFYFAKSVDPNNFRLERFTIPRDASLIEITYRLRVSNEVLGSPQVIRSVLV